MIPLPRDVSDLQPLRQALDAVSHDERVSWMRGLGSRQMNALYELAEGNPVVTEDFLFDEGVSIWEGKNAMLAFNRFQKRFARVGDQVAGFNWNEEIAGPLTPIVKVVTGPGHFVVYDSPVADGEVWIDYRELPTRAHEAFPPLRDNDHGLPSLVYGNMVDIVRRVAENVLVGMPTKKLPEPGPRTLGARLGSLFPSPPFVLCARSAAT